jgi:bacterioferritin-associated ferredoxin
MSFLDKAKELGTAAVGLARLAFGGYDSTQVSDAVYQQRITTCKGCPHYKATLSQCGVCGCFLAIKARLEYDPVAQERTGQKTKTECPNGLWTS